MKLSRFIAFLVLSICSAVTAYSVPQTWTVTGNTGYTANIGFQSTGTYTVNGRAMAAGDAVGVFYALGAELKCGGYLVWGEQFGMTVWGDNDQTQVKDGFAVNEAFTFKLWDNVLQTEIIAPTMTLQVGNATYSANGMTVYNGFTGGTGEIPLLAPTLIAPANQAANVSINPTLSWSAVNTAEAYFLEVSYNNTFDDLIYNYSVNTTDKAFTTLGYNTTYFWRVKASRAQDESAWSEVRSFTTAAVPAAGNVTLNIEVLMTALWNGTSHKPVAVTLELRSGANINVSQLYKRVPALVSAAGIATAEVSELLAGSYWIVVRATGFLPIYSTTAQTLQPGVPFAYDLTRLAEKVSGAKPINGRYFMKVGDVDANNAVNNTDLLLIKSNSSATTSVPSL